MPQPSSAAEVARAAAHALRERLEEPPDVAVVLGSGWAAAADQLGEPSVELETADLPGFAAPTAPGHRAVVRLVEVGGARVLFFTGRVHLYEGRTPAEVVHPVRTAAAAGARVAVLTNAAGGLRADWEVGTPVLISDHVNLTGASPLEGARFIDMTHAYTARLREVARALDPGLPEGVYCGFRGPQFETPAEIRMARTIGADLAGMSTVLEAIAAREAGLDLLGISLVTNHAAGMSGHPLSGEEVATAAHAAVPRLADLLARLLPALARA